MNKQRKHYFTSYLSFFRISAEETGRNYFFRAEKTVEKTAFFPVWKKLANPAGIQSPRFY